MSSTRVLASRQGRNRGGRQLGRSHSLRDQEDEPEDLGAVTNTLSFIARQAKKKLQVSQIKQLDDRNLLCIATEPCHRRI